MLKRFPPDAIVRVSAYDYSSATIRHCDITEALLNPYNMILLEIDI